jgi:hypothetical protein
MGAGFGLKERYEKIRLAYPIAAANEDKVDIGEL